MSQVRIAVLVGSIRRDSINRKLALALAALAPQECAFEHVRIDDLPPYNQDDDANPSEPVKRLKGEVARSQGLLFVTPEYNRSIPGVLKNAIDLGSRPYGQSVFFGKPAAVVSQSPGAVGGFGAHHALRQTLVFLDMPVLQQPEMYISHSNELFDEQGAVKTEATRTFLSGFMTSFAGWIDRFSDR